MTMHRRARFCSRLKKVERRPPVVQSFNQEHPACDRATISAMWERAWCAIEYRAGKETGQAAWDEQGKLLYARGTASDAK